MTGSPTALPSLAGLGEVSQQQTLMLHKTVRAALSDAQLQTLADKNWQVA